MPFAAKLSLAAALLAILSAAGGPLAAQLGLLPPYTAFRAFALGTFTGSLLAVGFGLWTLVRTWNQPEALGRPYAWAGLLVGAGLMLAMALAGASAAKVPPIHDLTTDPDDPPAFRGRDLPYPDGDPKTPERQREAYPDLQPLRLDLPPAQAFEAARKAADSLGWSISESAPREGPIEQSFEATDTSRLFRFVDDVVVRVRPAPGTGSVVDLRSTSRDGVSDLGLNARRIREFRDELDQVVGEDR